MDDPGASAITAGGVGAGQAFEVARQWWQGALTTGCLWLLSDDL